VLVQVTPHGGMGAPASGRGAVPGGAARHRAKNPALLQGATRARRRRPLTIGLPSVTALPAHRRARARGPWIGSLANPARPERPPIPVRPLARRSRPPALPLSGKEPPAAASPRKRGLGGCHSPASGFQGLTATSRPQQLFRAAVSRRRRRLPTPANSTPRPPSSVLGVDGHRSGSARKRANSPQASRAPLIEANDMAPALHENSAPLACSRSSARNTSPARKEHPTATWHHSG
jgi:hypothetical protein